LEILRVLIQLCGEKSFRFTRPWKQRTEKSPGKLIEPGCSPFGRHEKEKGELFY